MATVSFISYQKQSPGTLAGVAGYVSQEKKTVEPENGHQLLSGQNCSPKFAHREFLATRDMHHKKSPVYFYHYTQSFHPDEPVTTHDAHRIAKEFAAQAWPDSEVLIATHVDADHIHSHFIVNAVCCESGKMLRQGPKTLEHLRKISDDICQAYQLSTLCNKKKNNVQGMSGREYRSAVKGQSWKLRLMTTIDLCMSLATSPEGFRREMKQHGYDMVWSSTRKHKKPLNLSLFLLITLVMKANTKRITSTIAMLPTKAPISMVTSLPIRTRRYAGSSTICKIRFLNMKASAFR